MSTHPLRVFKTKRKSLELGNQTHVVGILNLTPDSFSDGGEYLDQASAVEFFHKMVEAGASIIDIGGESTRPNHLPVSIEEEMSRVVPFVEKIRSQTNCLISIDTSKSEVAKAALEAGADIINDIWGAQRDPRMADVIAEYEAGCILMHNRESPLSNGENLMNEILVFLKKSIQIVLERGVNPEGICIDPGLGFGKNYSDNWEIMRNLERLHDLEVPVLLGASRKSMLAQLLTIKEPKDRLSGTLATTALAAMSRIDFVRVHDVKENIECAKVIDYCTNYEKN
jgi:dihydropteroate synthase